MKTVHGAFKLATTSKDKDVLTNQHLLHLKQQNWPNIGLWSKKKPGYVALRQVKLAITPGLKESL